MLTMNTSAELTSSSAFQLFFFTTQLQATVPARCGEGKKRHHHAIPHSPLLHTHLSRLSVPAYLTGGSTTHAHPRALSSHQPAPPPFCQGHATSKIHHPRQLIYLLHPSAIPQAALHGCAGCCPACALTGDRRQHVDDEISSALFPSYLRDRQTAAETRNA